MRKKRKKRDTYKSRDTEKRRFDDRYFYKPALTERDRLRQRILTEKTKPIKTPKQRLLPIKKEPDITVRDYNKFDPRTDIVWQTSPIVNWNRIKEERRRETCRKREERRVSLFASRRAGKGKKILGPRLKTPDSNTRCKG